MSVLTDDHILSIEQFSLLLYDLDQGNPDLPYIAGDVVNQNRDNIINNICRRLVTNQIQGKEMLVRKFIASLDFKEQFGIYPYCLTTRFSADDIGSSEHIDDTPNIAQHFRFTNDFLHTSIAGYNGYDYCNIFMMHNIINERDHVDPEVGMFWIYYPSRIKVLSFIDKINNLLVEIFNLIAGGKIKDHNSLHRFIYSGEYEDA